MAGRRDRQSTLELVAVPLLARAGPTLARVSPVRRTVVGLIEGWMRRNAAKSRVTSGLPHGVCDDQAAMRRAAAEAMTERGEALASASVGLAARGVAEMAVAGAAADVARELAAEGVGQAVEGAAEVGAAATI